MFKMKYCIENVILFGE